MKDLSKFPSIEKTKQELKNLAKKGLSNARFDMIRLGMVEKWVNNIIGELNEICIGCNIVKSVGYDRIVKNVSLNCDLVCIKKISPRKFLEVFKE